MQRIVPSLENGVFHVILFQLALIPLTTCRSTVASMAGCRLDQVVPLNQADEMHTFLGYFITVLIMAAVIVNIIYFAILCGIAGDESACIHFSSVEMITSYIMLTLISLVAITSYFRNKTCYKLFYVAHHVIFLLFAVVIVQNGSCQDSKAQVVAGTENAVNSSVNVPPFQWFIIPLLYYVCDRINMRMNHLHSARLLACSTVIESCNYQDKRAIRESISERVVGTIILTLQRPILFDFQPGQFAFLKWKGTSCCWEPVFMASGPSSYCLEFHISVQKGSGSWTEQLWHRIIQLEKSQDGCIGKISSQRIEFELMGPYGRGLPLPRTKGNHQYSHAVTVGSGQGIIPMLSLLKQHIRHLIHVDPDAHEITMQRQARDLRLLDEAHTARIGSLAQKIFRRCFPRKGSSFDRDGGTQGWLDPRGASEVRHHSKKQSVAMSLHNLVKSFTAGDSRCCPSVPASPLDYSRPFHTHTTKKLEQASFRATLSYCGTVLLGALAVCGVFLFGMILSGTRLNAQQPRPGLIDSLTIMAIIFQTSFAVVSIFLWDANHLFTYTDLLSTLVAPAADWYWWRQVAQDNAAASAPSSIISFLSLLVGYMTARMWFMTVQNHHHYRRSALGLHDDLELNRLDVILIANSASLVAEVVPEIEKHWDRLVSAWGWERAHSACRITMYVTDTDDPSTASRLRCELERSTLYGAGWIRFECPDWDKILEQHSIEMIREYRNSCTLLAVCGPRDQAQMMKMIHQHKLSHDMIIALTGNDTAHHVDFVSESHGWRDGKIPGSTTGSKLTMSLDDADLYHQDDDKVVGSRPPFPPSLTRRTQVCFGDDRGDGCGVGPTKEATIRVSSKSLGVGLVALDETLSSTECFPDEPDSDNDGAYDGSTGV